MKRCRLELAGEPYDLQAAMQAILADAAICQQAVAVTEAEAETLRSLGFPHVSVVGHMIEPNPTARPFAQRAGMLFVGAIHKEDSPNLDSLVWFVDAVLPLIEAELKWETRLTIAGYIAPGIDMSRFEHHPRITLRGPVADLSPLYNAHRVFVAPTRYAAGAPYKVLEAASRGVPVVATEVLRGQLDWSPEQEILAAGVDDPERFAAHIVALYRDETLWQSVREGALRRLRQENGREDFARAVVSVLTTATRRRPTKTRPVPKIRTFESVYSCRFDYAQVLLSATRACIVDRPSSPNSVPSMAGLAFPQRGGHRRLGRRMIGAGPHHV